jgi:Ku protein
MMPRAYWKGFLRLSLVTCPIELFPASSQAEKTHLHQINKKTGNRLRQQMVDEDTGRVVESDEKGRGYELSKGRYVEIEEDELKRSKSKAPTSLTSTASCRGPRSTSATSINPITLPQAARRGPKRSR